MSLLDHLPWRMGLELGLPGKTLKDKYPLNLLMSARPKCFVIISAGFCTPGHLVMVMPPLRIRCWIHKSATLRWRTRPRPSRLTMPMAAVASLLIDRVTSRPKSLNPAWMPNPSVAPLTTADSSDSPLLKAMTSIVLDQDLIN